MKEMEFPCSTILNLFPTIQQKATEKFMISHGISLKDCLYLTIGFKHSKKFP